MNHQFELSLAQLGILSLTIPAALIILIGREWFLHSVLAKIGFFADSHYGTKEKNPVQTFDLWSFFLMAFWNFSWGGLISRGKKDTLVSYIFAQLWFIILIVISLIFLHTKNLSSTSYMYLLLTEIIRKSWVLHLVNYIPVPPFDASFFYAQKPQWRNVSLIAKILVTILIVLFPVHNDFITGDIILKWIGL